MGIYTTISGVAATGVNYVILIQTEEMCTKKIPERRTKHTTKFEVCSPRNSNNFASATIYHRKYILQRQCDRKFKTNFIGGFFLNCSNQLCFNIKLSSLISFTIVIAAELPIAAAKFEG